MKINNVTVELEIVTETEANGIKTLCKGIKKKTDLTCKILDILDRAVPEDGEYSLSLTEELQKVQSDLVKVAKALDWERPNYPQHLRRLD